MSRVLVARSVAGGDRFSEANAIGRAGLFPLERDLLDAIVGQALGGNEMWRRQIGHLRVSRRRFSAHGFQSEFTLSDPAMMVVPFVANEVVSGWIRTDLPGGRIRISHVLYIERGTMVMLEGTVPGEAFPAEIGAYEVVDDRGSARKSKAV
ncbi:hypothetical protein [Hypericibacter sp.]|uniref:hypothetical protein n=1 Tax=Hypericibacter sp. TaxID=2705401 RepID=UPI003D6CC30C